MDPKATHIPCHLWQQCPIPGYDLEAARSSSPTPTLLEGEEEDIAHDLKQRGIKVCNYVLKKESDGATNYQQKGTLT